MVFSLSYNGSHEAEMATHSSHPITVEQYLESFEGSPELRDELIFGRIVVSPKPKPLHQQIRINIERLLEPACEETAFTVNGRSSIKFPQLNSMPAPDVFVVPIEEWKRAIAVDEYLSTPPLLAVEVLSESNRWKTVSDKLRIYQEAGVSEVWVVDPSKRKVSVTVGPDEQSYQAHEMIRFPRPLSEGGVTVSDIFAGVPSSQLNVS